MAESITIARPYTKAAFATALAQGELQSWSEILTAAGLAVANTDLKQVLDNPALSDESKADLVISVCKQQGKVSDKAQNFMHLLAQNKRLTLLAEISKLYEVLKANHEKSIDISITSAFELDKSQQSKLAKVLASKLAREVKVTTHTDASLIGGVIVHAEDLVIDGSVRGKLHKLAEAVSA